ncbi:MAG: PRC-barrel domain-containing protein [Pedobacter sp.]|nr:PRC-barrel domain-containing protein [Pedobacter sp.]
MTTEETNEYRRLESLAGSDYEIADGNPEIQGWVIKDDLGEQLGEVRNLLFNPSSKKVRYIVADVALEGIEPKRILIPIGLAELHETDDEVYLPGITIAQLYAAPDYTDDVIAEMYEEKVLNTFRSDSEPSQPYTHDMEKFYSHPHFDDQRIYHKRNLDRGRIE